MKKLIARFASDESGATSIEYGLIAVLLGLGVITAVTTLGDSITGMYENVATEISGVGKKP